MSPAVSSSVGIVAYLALFAAVGLLFVFGALLVGRFVRGSDPHDEKLEIYECGEPAIGSSFVQFDLRFYVVALLFIIFDVEVAFFFPWATVFGKSMHLADERLAVVSSDGAALTDDARLLYKELGVRSPQVPQEVPASLSAVAGTEINGPAAAEKVIHAGARQLALVTIIDILVFFAVLLVGFAYVWKRGDLDWVRAFTSDRAQGGGDATSRSASAEESVLSA